MRSIIYKILVSLLFFLGFQHNYAQLVVTNYNSITETEYPNETLLGTDTIYIIYSPDKNGFDIEANLQALHKSVETLNYNWYRYNETTNLFDSIFAETAVITSNFSTDLQGGYKVRVTNNDFSIDTSYITWLFIEDFKITDIRVMNSTCTKIELQADTQFESTFYYYDLITFDTLDFTNKATIKWSVQPDYTPIPGIFSPSIDPPVEPVTFTATITDDLNYSRSFSNTIDEYSTDRDDFPIIRAVKANFKGIATSGSDPGTEPKDSTVRPEAPYGVWFVNDTKNGSEFLWYFYNHPLWKIDEADSLLKTSDFFEPIDSIFYKHPAPLYNANAGYQYKEGYDVKLFAWGPIYNTNNDRCLDTIRKIDFVIVDTTEFPATKSMLPNVFNPVNGTGKNKRFYFLDDEMPISVKYFSIKIYNRWGNKIYDFEDTDGSWSDGANKGWDGNTNWGGLAKPGVYYYVILAQGWDGREFKVPGFIHIFY